MKRRIGFGDAIGRRLHTALGAIRVPNRHEVRKAARAFVLGEEARASCGVPRHKGESKVCTFESTGTELRAKGEVIARRAAPNVDVVEICLPKAGETAQRYAASAVMSALKAGISVRPGLRDGGLLISGRRGRAKAQWPGCVVVKVTKRLREEAAKNIVARVSAAEEARQARMKRSAAARKGARTKARKRPGYGKPYRVPANRVTRGRRR